MTETLIIAGSPSRVSKTSRLAALVGERLTQLGVDNSVLEVKSLPADALVHARIDVPEIQRALDRVNLARGIVIATPIYKAAYSGLLKLFLDLFPQFGLRGKVVLPLATGGSLAHVLSLDYALRPVISSLDPLHAVAGLFVLDTQIGVRDDGSVELDFEISSRLDQAIGGFSRGLRLADRFSDPE